MKILTVSIAAYNADWCLKKCLDSFIASKYLDLLDIIVVNDGSKDNTAAIASEYVKKFSASIRLINKENGGHGSTINTSIDNAMGKYFKIVDSDDWVDTEALDALIELLMKTEADLVINDYNEVYGNVVKKIDVCKTYNEGVIYSFSDIAIEDTFPMHSLSVRFDKLKKVKEKISTHRFYVDTEFIFFAAMKTKTIMFQKNTVYQYLLGQNGQSVSGIGVYNHIEDLMFVEERLINIYDNAKDQDLCVRKYLFNILQKCYKCIFCWYTIMPKADKDYLLKKFDEKIWYKYPKYRKEFELGVYSVVPLNYLLFIKVGRLLKKYLR